MAIYKRDIVDINLETGNIHRSFLKHSIGYLDQAADHFGIRVLRNGEPVDLTGVTVQGIFMPPQGNPIAITTGNIIEENVAEVVLPQACYNYDGQFCLSIKLVDATNAITGTMRIVDGMVDNTHASGTVAPTETVPTYQEILSVYADMVTALVTVDELDDEVSDLKSALETTNNILKLDDSTPINWYKDKDVSVDSRNGNDSSSSVYSATNYIDIRAFDRITYKRNFTTSNVITAGIAFYDESKVFISGSGVAGGTNAEEYHYEDNTVSVPTGAVYIRCTIFRDTSYGVFSISGHSCLANIQDEIDAINARTSPVKNLFNDEPFGLKSGVTVVSSHEFTGTAGSLSGTINIVGDYKTGVRYTVSASAYNSTTEKTGNGLKFVVYYTDETNDQAIWGRDNNTYLFKAHVSAQGKTVDHITIAYGAGSSDVWYIKDIQIEESVGATTFEPYESTDVDLVARKKYDVISTGDTTDRTNDIMSALRTNGVCRLSPGLFCTTGITMPVGSMIVGSGAVTDVRLLPTSDDTRHITINLGMDCTVKNLTITGSDEEIEVPTTFGNRHGIGYFGTGTGSEIKRCVIEGCYIRSFTGGGITAYNTGYGARGMSVSDCNIYNNYCGFHDEHLSEYHCFHGCNITHNYIGVLNNGGNNRFVSCNITANETGFMMDNSSGTHNNDGHGVCVGCVLHHNHIPIYIHSGDSGFTFTGCSIAPDEATNDGIFIISSKRTVFSGCNFCKAQKITVNGGNLLMFVGCIFRTAFSANTFINVDGRNTSIRFNACYTDDGVVVDPTAT